VNERVCILLRMFRLESCMDAGSPYQPGIRSSRTSGLHQRM